MRVKNFKLVLDKIIANPEQWDQVDYHSDCRTKHCFAGWAQILAGQQPLRWNTCRDASVYLDITSEEARYLFNWQRTIEDFEAFYEQRKL